MVKRWNRAPTRSFCFSRETPIMKTSLINIFLSGRQRIVLGALSVGFLSASAGAQDTIFDTTGGRTAFTFPGYQIGGDGSPVYTTALEFGVFTPTSLSSIGLFLYNGDAPTFPNPLYTVQLTYSGATQPGAVIDSWNTYGSDSMVTLTPNSTDTLDLGVYDVVVSCAVEGAWSINYNFYGTTQFIGPTGTNTIGWITSAQEALPEMQINVKPAATPEPASFAAMGAGLFGLLLRRRAVNRGSTVVEP
jgi:hypothetical protein